MHILKKAKAGGVRTNEAADVNGSQRRGTRGKRRGSVAVVVALSVLGGALPAFAAFSPDPLPRAYAGRYVLFYDDAFAGPVRTFSGCASQIIAKEIIVGGQPKVSPVASVLAPCVIDVGLNMSEGFRSAVVAALTATPVVGEWAIGQLNNQGSAVVSEIRLRGYISDVTLPTMHRQSASDPSWIRVELMSSDGRLRKVTNPTRNLGNLEEDPIEAAHPMISFDARDVGRNVVAADPFEFIREDGETLVSDGEGRTWKGSTPSRALKFSHPRLRVAEAPRAVNALTAWVESTSTDRASVTLSYTSVSGAYRLEVSMIVFPTHFDPYPRTDNRRLLVVAGDPVVTASWGPPAMR